MGSTSRILSSVELPLENKAVEFIGLAESALFKDEKSENEKEKQIESYRFFNSAFPFFLPEAQHNMDVLSFSGDYWGHAIHFLLSNKAHGCPMWKNFQEQIRLANDKNPCKPHISASTTNQTFKHLSKMAVNPAGLRDFLLNETVLVQLPFQPVLLFQWLTASMQQVALFEYEMSEFYNFPFPKKYKSDVLFLHELLKSTHRNIGFLFDYLQQQVENENEIFVGHLETFEKFLKEVHAFNQFFFDASREDRLKILKAKCWKSSKSQNEFCRLKKGRLPLRNRNFIFNLDFWKSSCRDRKIFGRSYERLVRKQEDLGGELTEIEYQQIFTSTFSIPIMYYGSLRDQAGFVKCARKYIQVNKLLELLHIKQEDRGLIGSVIFNIAAIARHDARNHLGSYIMQLLKLSHSRFIDLPVTRKEMMDSINKKPLSEMIGCDSFSLKEISRELRNQNNSLNINLTKRIYRTKVLDTQYFVGLQEYRMQKLVLNCIDDHLKIETFKKEKDDLLRDWQVALYLMPCFVASYNDLSQLDPPVDKTFLFWYLQFVYNMNKEYEEGVRKSSWANIKKDIKETPVLRDKRMLLEFFESVTSSFDEKISAARMNVEQYCPSLKSLYEVLTNSIKDGPSHDEELASEPGTYWNWLMWDFFNKIKNAIEKADQKVLEEDAKGTV